VTRRGGFGVLATVVMLAFAASMVVFAMHQLWRGSSRSLFALEEDRQLTNLCRSALAEALYTVETQAEQGQVRWLDFCTQGDDPPDERIVLKHTRKFTDDMTSDKHLLQYSLGEVAVHRVMGVSYASGMSGRAGAIDFIVTAKVERHNPTHSAQLTLTERHTFWFSAAPTPFPQAQRHIEVLPTPVATFVKVE
jgi:hypothetical protein